MTQIHNAKSHDYELPPRVTYMLMEGHTVDLWCRWGCGRKAYVDPITILDRYGADFDCWRFDQRAVCKECGGRMKLTGGVSVSQLRHAGKVKALITSASFSFRRPVFASPPHF
jgi:hypothetical protein